MDVSFALSVQQQSYLPNSQDNLMAIDIHKALNNIAVNELYYYN
jgi:hypothetical protein